MENQSDLLGYLFSGVYLFIWLIVALLTVIALWRIFTKAGEAGWKSIIPIWNVLVWLKIIGRPWWWLLLLMIPFVDIIILFIMYHDTSLSFGHGVGFTLGLIFLSTIFLLVLGLGGSKYVGPRGMVAPAPAPAQYGA